MSVASPTALQDVPLLESRDLRTFDDHATRLIHEAQAYGWRGRVSSKGHVILKAPDGVASMSISRDSLRGRSGRNMRAELDRWVRARNEKAAAEQARDSFGLRAADRKEFVNFAEWIDGRIIPVRTLVEMRRHDALRQWWDGARESMNEAGMVFDLVDPDNPRTWFVLDCRIKPAVLVAHGSQVTHEVVWASLVVTHAQLFDVAANQGAATGVDSSGGDQNVKMYVCGECDARYVTEAGRDAHVAAKHPVGGEPMVECEDCGSKFVDKKRLGSHRTQVHTGVAVPCDEPGCDFTTGRAHQLAFHKRAAHSGPSQCPVCGKVCKNLTGLDRHVAVHKPKPEPEPEPEPVVVDEVAPAEAAPVSAPALQLVPAVAKRGVARRAATVAPPVDDDEDVLLTFLEFTPQGEDAEAIVARLRALVASPLVEELRATRAALAKAMQENEELQHRCGELEARVAVIKEAMAL